VYTCELTENSIVIASHVTTPSYSTDLEPSEFSTGFLVSFVCLLNAPPPRSAIPSGETGPHPLPPPTPQRPRTRPAASAASSPPGPRVGPQERAIPIPMFQRSEGGRFGYPPFSCSPYVMDKNSPKWQSVFPPAFCGLKNPDPAQSPDQRAFFPACFNGWDHEGDAWWPTLNFIARDSIRPMFSPFPPLLSLPTAPGPGPPLARDARGVRHRGVHAVARGARGPRPRGRGA